MVALLRYIPIILAILSINFGGKKEGTDKKETGGLTLGTAVLIIALYWYISSTWSTTVAEEESKNVNDPNVLLAQRIRNAVNPWGWDWSIDLDSYDKDALLTIAREIKSKKQFDLVAQSYSRQYSSDDMVQRLRKEMGETYTLFIQSLGFNGNGGTGGTATVLKKGDKCYANGQVNALSTKNSSKVLETFYAGEYVGIYQGTDILTKTNVRYALLSDVDTGIFAESAYVLKSKLYKQ
jgi:hypothetical protein